MMSSPNVQQTQYTFVKTSSNARTVADSANSNSSTTVQQQQINQADYNIL